MQQAVDEDCETDSSTDLGYEAASEDPGVVLEREVSHVRGDELRDIVDSFSLEQLRRLVLSAASTHASTLTEVVSAAEAADTAESVVSASTASLNDYAIPRSYYRAPDSQAIPDELLLVIFSTLDHTSLARAGSVNRQWRSTAFHRWRQLHSALLAGEHVAPPPAVTEEPTLPPQPQQQPQPNDAQQHMQLPDNAAPHPGEGLVNMAAMPLAMDNGLAAIPMPNPVGMQFPANPLAMQALMLMLQQQQQQQPGQAAMAAMPPPIMGALPGAPPVLGGFNVQQLLPQGMPHPAGVFIPGWAHGQLGMLGNVPVNVGIMGHLRRRRPVALSVPVATSWQQFTVNCYKMELWRAVQAADRGTAENLLKKGTDPNASHDGQPVLWTALRHGHHAMLQQLLDWGANPHTSVDDGALLYYCVDTGNARAMKMLLDAGADVDAMTKLCPHNWEDRWRSAFVAAMEGDQDLKSFLMRQGADELEVARSCAARLAGVPLLGSRAMTALQHACINGSTTLVRVLLDAGANCNITAGGKGRTALHLTIRHLKPSTDAFLHVIDALLEAGADVSMPDTAGNTPLALLIKRGSVTTEAPEIRRVQTAMEMVLRWGGDPNTHVVKTAGAVAVPALLTAVNHQHYGMARVLVANGADINCVDPRNGCTALHKIMTRITEDVSHKPRARAFFDFLSKQRGLDPMVVAHDGTTAWQLCRGKGLWVELRKMAAIANLPLPSDAPPAGADDVPEAV